VESGCPGALEAVFVFHPSPGQQNCSALSRCRLFFLADKDGYLSRIPSLDVYSLSHGPHPPRAEDGKQWELDGVETGAERRRGGGDVYASLTPDIK